MTDRKSLNRMGDLLTGTIILGGAALIFFFFFIIVPKESRDIVSWINLNATIFAYSVSVFAISRIFVTNKADGDVLPAITLNLVFVGFYDVFIIIMLIVPRFLDNKWYYLIHGTAFFLIVVMLAVAFVNYSHAKVVNNEEDEMSFGRKSIKSILDSLSYKVNRISDSYSAEKNKFYSIQDNARYISPNPNPEAVRLEGQIKEELSRLEMSLDTVINGGAGDKKHINQILANLTDKLDMRKKLKM